MDVHNILMALMWFAILGGGLGILLAIASKLFAVPVNKQAEAVEQVLPGANCGGCGYTGCAACALAISEGKARVTACTVGGQETADKISEIMGVSGEKAVRMRAQVMCSGTEECSKKKYDYVGVSDCVAAVRLGGGNKMCPNGCIGLGTCVSVCRFGAIKVVDGVSTIDYSKCTGCGTCVAACPKHIIKLIPFDAAHWVGCMSVDNGKITRSYCDVGCISCKMCQKNCPAGAITVDNFVASIDYSKCIDCGMCVEKCPRKIIWSSRTADGFMTISSGDIDHSVKGTAE